MKQDWMKKALKITGMFEGSDLFRNVSGNFDGQVISAGILQFCLGQASLQPLLKDFYKKHGEERLKTLCPTYSGLIKNIILSTSLKDQMALGKQPQSDKNTWKVFRNELRDLMGSPEMIEIQLKFCGYVVDKAYRYSEDFAKNFAMQPNFHQFSFFVDIVTQNGSLKDKSYKTVKVLVDNLGMDDAIESVFDWCNTATKDQAGYNDLQKNENRWSSILKFNDNLKEYQQYLFLLAYQRVQTCSRMWQLDVLNRKCTLALGSWMC